MSEMVNDSMELVGADDEKMEYTVEIKTPNTVPPIVPSQVLLGDISSNNLCCPINLPVK